MPVFRLPHSPGVQRPWATLQGKLERAKRLDWREPRQALRQWTQLLGDTSKAALHVDSSCALPAAMRELDARFGVNPADIMAFVIQQALDLPALFPEHAAEESDLPSAIVKGADGSPVPSRAPTSHTFSAIPILMPTAPATQQQIVFSRKQLCSLLAHAFLGTLMQPGAAHGEEFFVNRGELPDVGDDHDILTGSLSFIALLRYPSKVAMHRTLCMLLYFAQMKEHMGTVGDELVAFERHTLAAQAPPPSATPSLEKGTKPASTSASTASTDSPASDDTARHSPGAAFDVPDWASCESCVGRIIVHDKRMEDVRPMSALVDFANRDLMIHEVIPSATQEEVLFSTRPELFVSMLFIPRLRPHEAAVMRNSRMVVDYTGYQATFAVKEKLEMQPSALATPAIARPTTCSDVVAIDAVVNRGLTQFTLASLYRDLNKAYAGFCGCFGLRTPAGDKGEPQADESTGDGESREHRGAARVLSSGLWGCGVFGGDPVLKMLQQLMVTSHLGVDLHFSTYKQPSTQAKLQRVVALLAQLPDLKVRDLFSIMTAAPASGFARDKTVFGEFVIHQLKQRAGQPSEFDTGQFACTEAEVRIRHLMAQAEEAEEKADRVRAMALYQRARAIDRALFDALMMPSA
ncbi:hypothetical protein PTSG_01037 [Salpingoeca rosetta]|uniref:poly(ADP-ribose) glycohydrolase n=1 Tax=Salpingoeca rosetta (strain ATCC 50818 / BSB-021) TaxID=946362 RepID=F2TY78_SALR5|nr:uncharacterized protein PTSG_01037 [Salpingoeca rosetta]EGD76337.1 hypothetical protein PTSG_01037 [Salpingoeca rosetta]|eukprot:XP_004998512.1 hypothetical protein PTSG_01037 [Salpingoeca rosetta]